MTQQEILNCYGLSKKAAAPKATTGQLVLDAIYSNLPYVNIPQGAGALAAQISGTSRKNSDSLLSNLPVGNSLYTTAKRKELDAGAEGSKNKGKFSKKLMHETLGKTFMTLLGSGAGATIGALTADKNARKSAILERALNGAMLGSSAVAIPNLITQMVGYAKKGDNQAHRDYVNSDVGALMNYVVPGYAGYRAGQRDSILHDNQN